MAMLVDRFHSSASRSSVEEASLTNGAAWTVPTPGSASQAVSSVLNFYFIYSVIRTWRAAKRAEFSGIGV